MRSLEEHLVDEDARLLMLLTPPFDQTENDPGYIKGYLPGVRENGAQYTHAALWAVLATALQGDGDRAFELYQMINPLTHARTPGGGRDLQGGALRRRRRRLHREGPARPRRLDLVHRLGELDVSRRAGRRSWASRSGATRSTSSRERRPHGRNTPSSTATAAAGT